MSPSTCASVDGARPASRRRLSSSTWSPSPKSPGPKSDKPVCSTASAMSTSPSGYRLRPPPEPFTIAIPSSRRSPLPVSPCRRPAPSPGLPSLGHWLGGSRPGRRVSCWAVAPPGAGAGCVILAAVGGLDRARLDRAFDARTVAVIGPSRANGYFWLKMFEGFEGTVVSVHVNPESIREIEAMGIRNYRRIGDVPGSADYVVVNTPRRLAIDTFAECIEAGVGAVSFFTAGFAETDDEGRAIQATLARMSRESSVPLLGPNCTGIYNPAAPHVLHARHAHRRPRRCRHGQPERDTRRVVRQGAAHLTRPARSAWSELRQRRRPRRSRLVRVPRSRPAGARRSRPTSKGWATCSGSSPSLGRSPPASRS